MPTFERILRVPISRPPFLYPYLGRGRALKDDVIREDAREEHPGRGGRVRRTGAGGGRRVDVLAGAAALGAAAARETPMRAGRVGLLPGQLVLVRGRRSVGGGAGEADQAE